MLNIFSKFMTTTIGILLCVSAIGAQTTTTRRQVSSQTIEGSAFTHTTRPASASFLMTTGASIAVGSGAALPGISFTVAGRILRSAPLYVGGDFAAFFSTVGGFGIVMPILPTMYFEFAPHPDIHPLIGVSAGPVITAGQSAGVVFGMFFKPGVNLFLSPDVAVNIEPRLGVMGATFVFAPQLGATFTL